MEVATMAEDTEIVDETEEVVEDLDSDTTDETEDSDSLETDEAVTDDADEEISDE
jgi:hypothetical protein